MRSVACFGCVSATTQASGSRPCDVMPGKTQAWCNPSLTLEERVADLVARIPDEDVPALLTSPAFTGPVRSLNIPKYQWWNEGLHGVGYSPGVSFRGDTLAATSFPQVVTTSMSFNTSLFRQIGSAISTEARAFHNSGNAGLSFWTPNVNIFRDPRWGRGQETPGEDPMLSSNYAVNFVRGMQEGSEDANHLKASACLKHYTAYDMEKWGRKNRHTFDAQVSAQDRVETFDPPFEAGVRDGHASCVMCSYNSVNGVPSCASRPTLTDEIRGDWGLDGYITSDCGAVMDILTNHRFTHDLDNTSWTALNSGMDTDCGIFFRLDLGHAMKDGVVSRSMVDKALSHLFRVRMRFGEFDPVDMQPFAQFGPDRINTAEHQLLALDAARQGIALLKNANNALPFDKDTVTRIAVVGPSSRRTNILKGNYNGKAPFLISVAKGLERYGEVKQVDGCWAFPEAIVDYDPRIERSSGCSHANIAPAEAAAKSADVTVVVVGLDQQQESEGHDRTDLLLPGHQRELAERVAAASTGPVVLVVMAGGAVDVAFARDSSKFAAIMFVGYPGEAGGQAIAETIFGGNNPSGRLTQTFYPADYIQQWNDASQSYFDMGMRPDPEGTGNPGRGYRFYTGKPVFSFGTGLSYTDFEYVVNDTSLDLSDGVSKLEVQVCNTGHRAGRHVLLAFVEPPKGSKADGLQRRLTHFAAVEEILAGACHRSVELSFAASDFQLVDRAGVRTSLPGVWQIRLGSVDSSFTVPVRIPSSVFV